MKIRFISFALAGIMTLGATTGCRKDKPVEPDPTGRVEVNLKANIKPPSKLKVANNQWEASDRVGLFMKQAGALTMESVYEDADNLQMSIDGQTLKSVSPVYYPLKGNVDFIAYYPYITSVEGNYTVPVNVAEQAAGLPVEVLYSNNATNKAPVEAPVMLDFRYSLAKIIVHVTGDNLTTGDLAGMSVSVGNMYTKAWLQLINGTFTAHQGKADIALYRNANASTTATAVFEALVLPTLVAENVTYTFSVNDENYTLALKNESYAAATQYELFVDIDAPAPQRTAMLLNATITPRTPDNSREFSIGISPPSARFVINVDCWHFFQSRTDQQMNNVANIETLIDQYARGKVTHVFLNTNGERAAFRSKTREAFWDPVPGIYSEEDMLNFAEPRRAKILYDNGIDPYEIWIRRCREKGISPWLSMRMNDVHYGDDRTHHWHSEFSRSNPQYWRVPYTTTTEEWNSYALDYAHQAVREHQLAFFEEMLERYDPDGIELDWIRNPYHLRQGRYTADAHFLDEFVRDAHNLTKEWADRRGHNIELAVRVPTSPVASEALGLNADRWVRDGLADMIIISPYFATTDWDPPIDLWRERVGKTNEHVPILACAEWQTQAYIGAVALTSRNLPMIYGFVDNARFRGADGIYMFNWFSVTGSIADKLFAEGIDTKTIMSNERRYPVTYRDIAPVAGVNNVQLPVQTNVTRTIRIPMGSVPQNGEVYLILGFEQSDGLATATFSASMNGKDLGQHEDEKSVQLLGSSPQRAVKFRVPWESLQEGENIMALLPTSGIYYRLVWVELRAIP